MNTQEHAVTNEDLMRELRRFVDDLIGLRAEVTFMRGEVTALATRVERLEATR